MRGAWPRAERWVTDLRKTWEMLVEDGRTPPSPTKLLERLDEFERLVDELGLATNDATDRTDDIAA